MNVAIVSLGADALEINILDTLEKKDYARFLPQAEQRIREHGRISLLIRATNFRGWTPSALWEDLKFDARHYGDVERLAIVGRDDSGKWMATVSRPFTAADVRYFPETELEAARAWVRSGKAPAAPDTAGNR